MKKQIEEMERHIETEKGKIGDWRAQLDKEKWIWMGIKCKKVCMGEQSEGG